MNLYVQCFLIAVLGMALKAWIKFMSMRSKAIQANIKFDSSEYFRNDWPVLVGSLIAIGICMFVIDNALNYKPWMIDAIKPIFAFVGYTGADIIITLFSAANKKINNVIDLKTTIADTRTGGTQAAPTQLPKDNAK